MLFGHTIIGTSFETSFIIKVCLLLCKWLCFVDRNTGSDYMNLCSVFFRKFYVQLILNFSYSIFRKKWTLEDVLHNRCRHASINPCFLCEVESNTAVDRGVFYRAWPVTPLSPRILFFRKTFYVCCGRFSSSNFLGPSIISKFSLYLTMHLKNKCAVPPYFSADM